MKGFFSSVSPFTYIWTLSPNFALVLKKYILLIVVLLHIPVWNSLWLFASRSINLPIDLCTFDLLYFTSVCLLLSFYQCPLSIVLIISLSIYLFFIFFTRSNAGVFLLFPRTTRGKHHSTVRRSMDTLRWSQCCFRSWPTRLWETTDKRPPWTWRHFMDAFRSGRMKNTCSEKRENRNKCIFLSYKRYLHTDRLQLQRSANI